MDPFLISHVQSNSRICVWLPLILATLRLDGRFDAFIGQQYLGCICKGQRTFQAIVLRLILSFGVRTLLLCRDPLST